MFLTNKNGLEVGRPEAIRRDDSSIAPGSFELAPILNHHHLIRNTPRADLGGRYRDVSCGCCRPRSLQRRRSLKGNQGSTGLLPPRPDHSGNCMARVGSVTAQGGSGKKVQHGKVGIYG